MKHERYDGIVTRYFSMGLSPGTFQWDCHQVLFNGIVTRYFSMGLLPGTFQWDCHQVLFNGDFTEYFSVRAGGVFSPFPFSYSTMIKDKLAVNILKI